MSKLSVNFGHIGLPRSLIRAAAAEDDQSEPRTEDVDSPRAGGGKYASAFANARGCADDPILGVRDAFLADPEPHKLNLAVGVYRTDDGRPLVLKAVQSAEEAVLAEQRDGAIDKEYLPPDGLGAFCRASLHLLFGDALDPALADGRVVSTQCLSGLGGLHLAGRMIAELMPGATVHVPEPTWPIHPDLFDACGIRVATYPYYDRATCGLDFPRMLGAIQRMPAGAVVLLHACAHNPTGVDPTAEQWEQIADAVAARRLVPLLDSAYQGFASGDLDADAAGARALASRGIELMVCQSYAKNMGMYGERVGCFGMVCTDAHVADLVRQQLKRRIRLTYSSPPVHGARIATKILTDPARLATWKGEVLAMAARLRRMRVSLHAALTRVGCPPPPHTTLTSWTHVLEQRGMFTYTGLSASHVAALREEHHIYMPADGRLCMAALNDESCDTLAKAILKVLAEEVAPGQMAPGEGNALPHSTPSHERTTSHHGGSSSRDAATPLDAPATFELTTEHIAKKPRV